MAKPDFLAQNGEKLTIEERKAWFKREADYARGRGARLHRFSVHETEPHLILYEGWKDPRAEQGEQEWQFMRSAAPQSKEEAK